MKVDLSVRTARLIHIPQLLITLPETSVDVVNLVYYNYQVFGAIQVTQSGSVLIIDENEAIKLAFLVNSIVLPNALSRSNYRLIHM